VYSIFSLHDSFAPTPPRVFIRVPSPRFPQLWLSAAISVDLPCSIPFSLRLAAFCGLVPLPFASYNFFLCGPCRLAAYRDCALFSGIFFFGVIFFVDQLPFPSPLVVSPQRLSRYIPLHFLSFRSFFLTYR